MKSPPELWAEISDVSSLARHLGEFGEIRITKLEPETTVAWEGDTARGTVELQASGWGTKVTLTAELLEAAEPVTAEPVAQPAAVAPDPEPAAVAAEPEPEPVAVEPEPVAAEPEPVAAAEPAPVKLGFFARLFGRKPKPAPAPEPVAVAVEPEPEPEPANVEPEPEPVAAQPEPEPAAEPEPPTPAATDRRVDHETAQAVLTAVLDDLGAAHHRPFSRS